MADPASDESELLIAIASDLHAFDEIEDGGVAPSHLRVGDPEDQPGRHPIAGLLKLVDEADLHADLLLCPGDLAHKARPTALQYSWRALYQLKEALGAQLIAATSGNHDLDSHFNYNDDAKGVLQALIPPYPLPDDSQNDHYWSRNFSLLVTNNVNLLILNSSAYHGTRPEELDHGRISDATLSRLRQALMSADTSRINILLCHHHPQQHSELKLGEYDVMKNGQPLLDLLGTGEFGRWLVIHGHKHHPKLTYAMGGSTSPIILSAGSLCISLYLELQTRARNQFHIVHLPRTRMHTFGLVGQVRSWDWASGVGWAPAGAGSGLPALCGFGYRGDPRLLASEIATQVTAESMSWDVVVSQLPQLAYMIPQDIDALRRDLDTFHGLKIEDDYKIGPAL